MFGDTPPAVSLICACVILAIIASCIICLCCGKEDSILLQQENDERQHSLIDNGGGTLAMSTIVHRNTDYLDSPPTYADSTQNSRTSSLHSLQNTNNQDEVRKALPPSYEEALSNSVNSVNTTSATYVSGRRRGSLQ